MKTLLINSSFALLLLFSSQGFALDRSELQTGDVVLLSLNCMECRMIESETDSAFSHSGVIVVDEAGVKRVAQSLGRVDHVSFADFTKNITPKTGVAVYRPREFKFFSTFKIQNLEKSMFDIFKSKYVGAPFDSKYEWNNFNAKGEELLYCSEFIAKFLDHFLTQKTTPTLISYVKNYAYWYKYFKGAVPENELGNSPASFSRDDRFVFLGTIY
jgi:hypothetical protein